MDMWRLLAVVRVKVEAIWSDSQRCGHTEKISEFALDAIFLCLTTELTDAGGQRPPNWQLTRPARVRSSDLVELSRCAAG